MDYELEMCDRKAKEIVKQKYGLFWKFKLKEGELFDTAYKLWEDNQKKKGIIKPKKESRKEIKSRKLIGKAWIKCPDHHESFCNVYEDNGFQYYICSVCNCVVGLPIYNLKNKEESFSGHNTEEIMEIFKIREEALSNSSPPARTSDRKSDSASQKDLICIKRNSPPFFQAGSN